MCVQKGFLNRALFVRFPSDHLRARSRYRYALSIGRRRRRRRRFRVTFVNHPPARPLCLHLTVFRDISLGEQNAPVRPCRAEHKISPSLRFVSARCATAHGNVVLVARKRAHKNGGKPMAERIHRTGHGNFSADPRPISRFPAAAALSEKFWSPRRRLEATGGGCSRSIVQWRPPAKVIADA